MHKYFIGFFLFLFLSSPLLAQKGCIGTSIPLQTDGTMYISYSSYTGYYDLYGSKVVNPNASYCLSPTGRTCMIKGFGTYTGTEVNYGSYPCPIDSYAYPFLSLIGVFAVFKIRQRITKNLIPCRIS